MELGARIGLDEQGKEAGRPGLDKAGRQIDLSGTSDFVNCVQAGIGHEYATSH
jgi:hypothetical protein